MAFDKGQGYILALSQLKPASADYFFKLVREIAADLATRPVSDDELQRVLVPMKQMLLRASTGNAYWMNQMEGAAFDRHYIWAMNAMPRDMLTVTPEQLRALAAKYPNITLEVQLDNGVTDLMKRDADIAVRLARPIARELIARRVGSMTFALYAARDYIDQHGAPRSIDDLQRHQLVTFAWDEAAGGDEWRRILLNHPQIVFTSNSSIAQVHAVSAGYGVGLLPTYIEEEDPHLIAVLPDHEWPKRDIWLVADRDVKMSARVRAVYNEIASQFERERRLKRKPEPVA